jgi:uncharacterized protein (TIGR03437 family)
MAGQVRSFLLYEGSRSIRMDLKRCLALCAFSVVSLSAAPQLQLSSGAIGIVNIAPGANGPTQTVTATNAGDGALNLSVSSSASWLAASLAANNRIQIALNTASLAAGMYTEFVTVNSPGAIDAPQTISVTVQMGGVPASLQFYVAPSGGSASQQINTQSAVSASATTSNGGGWLSVSGQGSFNFFYPYYVTATSTGTQAPGDYTGNVVLTGGSNPADNKTVAVTLHVTSSPIAQVTPSTMQLRAIQGGAKITNYVSVANTGQGSLTISGATATANSGTWLSAAVVTNGAVGVTADPSGLAPGNYTGSVTLAGNAANFGSLTVPVELVVTANTGPLISFGGVVDNAIGSTTMAPGDIASVYGLGLGPVTPVGASSLPLGTNLGGTQVFFNNIPAPAYYASNGQVNFQVPFEAQPGPAQVSVTYNGQTGNTVSATIAPVVPRILRIGIGNYGIIVNQDQSFPMPPTPGINSHPARPGDTLVIYAIGLGATTPAVANGVASPGSTLATVPNVGVMFGGGFASPAIPGTVVFAGLTPGLVGLYQVNVIVPQELPVNNELGLMLTVGRASSLPVFVAIGN